MICWYNSTLLSFHHFNGGSTGDGGAFLFFFFFRCFAQFLGTRVRLCIIQVRFLLSICCLLLKYSFQSRPNIRALGTGGSVMTFGLSINGCSPSKNQFDEKKHDWIAQKFGLRRPQRLFAIQCEPPFPLLTHKDKRRLYSIAGWIPLIWIRPGLDLPLYTRS